jgi:hypothetical protein
VAAIENVGDVVDLLRARGGVPGGGPQVNVPKAGADGMDGNAGLQTLRGPVGAQRVRMREPLGYAGSRAAAPHQPMHADGGQGERILVAVAPDSDEQRLLVAQPDTTGERVDLHPRLERVPDSLGHGDLSLTPPLAALCRSARNAESLLLLIAFLLLRVIVGRRLIRNKSLAL